MPHDTDHRNPFTSPDSLSLADIYVRIEADETVPVQKKREVLSAIRSFGKWQNRRLEEIPANASYIRKAHKKFHPDHARISKRRVQNIMSLIKFALRHCGVMLNERTYLAEFTSEWQALWDLLDEKYARSGLSRFFRYCSAQGIDPEAVNDSVMHALQSALEKESLTKDPRVQRQTACRVWNDCVKSIQGWPQRPVTIPVYRKTYTKRLEEFPQAFQDDVAQFVERLRNPDVFGKNSPAKPLSPTSINSRLMQIRQLAAALIHREHDIAQITSLKYLVDHYREALQWLMDRLNTKQNGMIANIADCARMIAKYHVKVPEETLERITLAKNRLTPDYSGLTQGNSETLRQFDRSINVRRLLWLSEKTFERLAQIERPTRQHAVQASAALGAELLLYAPMRIKNLAALNLEQHVHWEKPGCKGRPVIMIPGNEVKNSVPLTFTLPPHVSSLLATYLIRYRPLLFSGANDHLFPGPDGKAKRSDTLSKQISRLLWESIGLRMNCHAFRHFAANLIVELIPGNYEGARRLLGHANIDTTYNFYQGAETKSAVNHWHQVLLGHRNSNRLDAGASPVPPSLSHKTGLNGHWAQT